MLNNRFPPMNGSAFNGSLTPIHIGECYEINYQGASILGKVAGQVVANGQGDVGPTKWRIQCFCALPGDPAEDGEELAVLESNFVQPVNKQEIVRRCLMQGWLKNNDIVDYLADLGIEINYSTVGSYKYRFREIWTISPSSDGPANPRLLPLDSWLTTFTSGTSLLTGSAAR